ncbi:unnamed protein product, partial [Sphagnum jensenii]
ALPHQVPSGTTLEVKDPSGGSLGLRFDNLPTPPTTSNILYYDPSTGLVSYGTSNGIDSVDFNCGIGTLNIYTSSGPLTTLERAWLLTGSTTIDTTNYFGTYNNDDIRVATNNENCVLDRVKQKMIIGSDANYGNVEIGYDGIHAMPSVGSVNKFLVQNGMVSSAPLATLTTAGYSVSGIGIAAYANDITDNTNIGYASLADNSSAQNSVGFLGIINNSTQSNNGVLLSISSTSTGISNSGIQTSINGNGDNNLGLVNVITDNNSSATNQGISTVISGNGATNTGSTTIVEGTNGNNIGESIYVGASTTTNINTGALINVSGSIGTASENLGVSSFATGASNFNVAINGNASGSTYTNYNYTKGNIGVWGNVTSGGIVSAVNSAVKGDATGNASFNTGFIGDIQGSDGATNIGGDFNTFGNGNASWGGPSTYPTGWQANVGLFSSVFGQNSINIGGMAEIIDNGGSANNGSQVYGLIGSSAVLSNSTCTSQIGIWGYLHTSPAFSTVNYGVEGDLSNLTAANLASGSAYCGIYGYAPLLTAGTNPGVLVNGTNPYSAYAGYFNGDVFSSVNYTGLIPVLVEAIKELKTKTDSITVDSILIKTIAVQQDQITKQAQQINDQGKQISDLRNMMYDLCNNGCAGFNPSNNSSTQQIQNAALYQSVPNPSSGVVSIGYVINMPYTNASINILTIDDKIISSYPINGQGSSTISFNGANLAVGVYKYYLIIDGKIIDAKSMNITK